MMARPIAPARGAVRKSQRKPVSTRKHHISSHFLVTMSVFFPQNAGSRGAGVIIYGMRILVTGASGFAGSRLIPTLLADGHEVCGLARDPARVDLEGIVARSSEAGVMHSPQAGMRAHATRTRVNASPLTLPSPLTILTGDVLSGTGLATALRGVEVAYYLIHSMERAPTGRDTAGGPAAVSGTFSERERIAAENFAAAAAAAGVRRIVYLGGPTASWTPAGAADTDYDYELSPHLASRETVGRILREGIPDTVTLRASIVIGARSRSLRFLVRLVERMPVLALPAWRVHRTRPIDARDVTEMLANAASVTAVAGQALDVGGPEILSYGEMIERIAELMLLARPAVGLAVNARTLTARVAAAIAEEDPELVDALMASLQTDLLPGGPDGEDHLRAAALLGVDLHSFDSSVECSLREWESVEPLAAR
jgi:uncharacterized protein YbjT (DUF2867 family)